MALRSTTNNIPTILHSVGLLYSPGGTSHNTTSNMGTKKVQHERKEKSIYCDLDRNNDILPIPKQPITTIKHILQ